MLEKVSRKIHVLGEFNEVGKSKTSLAKNSVEFDEFAGKKCSHQTLYLRLRTVRQTLHITVCEKVCGQNIKVPDN